MQITFDPRDSLQRATLLAMLAAYGSAVVTTEARGQTATFVHVDEAANTGGTLGEAMTALGLDQRDPAAVFGASAVPLALVPSTAGVTQSNSAPVVLPGSAPVLTPGTSAPVLMPSAPGTALPGGAAPTNSNPASTVDSSGLPWDHRIHASTKTTKKDGTWVAKRNLNDGALVASVEKELRAAMALPNAAPVANPAQTFAQQPATLPAGALPLGLPPLPGLPPAPVAAAIPQNFDELMPRLTAAQTAGVLPAGALEAALAAYQLPGVISLVSRADYVPTIWAYLQQQFPALA